MTEEDETVRFGLPSAPKCWLDIPGRDRVDVAFAVTVRVDDDKVTHGHLEWDRASLLHQPGLLDPAGLPESGAEQARLVLDPTGAYRTDYLLAVREADETDAAERQFTKGSRGSPRIRSPIWLRLISEVPPAIDMPRCHRTRDPAIAPLPSRNMASEPASSVAIAAAS